MEVMTSSPIQDFNFDSACTSPYNMSAATSPRRFGNFYSAPTSPSRFSMSGRSLEELEISHVPFSWEEKPGTPKCQFVTTTTITSTSASATTSVYGDAEQDLEEVDFAFDFSGHLDSGSLPADELFDQGRIKPLKPPPKFMYDQNKPVESPKTPKKLIIDAFSPRKKDGFDPFAAAIKETQKESKEEKTRGRERNVSSSSSRNKTARSLSPFRVSNLLFDTNSSNSFSVWYKKWKIKDLLLFRSASEGRASDNDQMKKYNMLKKSQQQDSYSSFRSTDSGEMSKRRSKAAPISAHELHYKINRAVSEEMKKRTSLPYRHGLLGCLGFHPTVPEMSNKGFGSGGSSMSRG